MRPGRAGGLPFRSARSSYFGLLRRRSHCWSAKGERSARVDGVARKRSSGLTIREGDSRSIYAPTRWEPSSMLQNAAGAALITALLII